MRYLNIRAQSALFHCSTAAVCNVYPGAGEANAVVGGRGGWGALFSMATALTYRAATLVLFSFYIQ